MGSIKIKKKAIVFVEYGVDKHGLGALMAKIVPKTRDIGHFVAAVNYFVFFFSAERTVLILSLIHI